MNQIPSLSLFGLDMTLYSLLALLSCLAFGGISLFFAPKHRLSRAAAGLHFVISGVLGLLFGRLIYCLVRADSLFYGSMGEFLGLSPFFDLRYGSVSIVGIFLGFVLAAGITGKLMKQSAARLMDHALLPAIAYFTFMRFIEHLGGHGNGDYLENPALCFFPIARSNEWGDWFVAVNTIEGFLGILLLLVLLFLCRICKKPGTLTLYGATLLAATQIIPESLRFDDVLYIFIFARVTHIGLALMLFTSLLLPLLQGQKQGLSGRAFWLEMGIMLLGIGLCIGAIFALDKTNLPKLLVYAVLFLTLVGLTFLNFRRIRKEDIR